MDIDKQKLFTINEEISYVRELSSIYLDQQTWYRLGKVIDYLQHIGNEVAKIVGEEPTKEELVIIQQDIQQRLSEYLGVSLGTADESSS